MRPGQHLCLPPPFCGCKLNPSPGCPSQELIVPSQAKHGNDDVRYLIMELIFLLKIRF